jgi:hypothetical protein
VQCGTGPHAGTGLGAGGSFTKGVAWSPDGSSVLGGSEDNVLRVFRVPAACFHGSEGADGAADGAPCAAAAAPAELEPAAACREAETVYDYAWYPLMRCDSPLSCAFAATLRDAPVHLWDAGAGGGVRASYGARNHLDELAAAYSLCFTPDGSRIYCGYDRCLRAFDLCRPGCRAQVLERYTSPTRKSREGQRGLLAALAFNPDHSGILAAGSYGSSVCLYAQADASLLLELDCGAAARGGGGGGGGGGRGASIGGVTQVGFSPCGRYLYSASRKDELALCWDVRATARVLRRYRRGCDNNQHVGFSLDPTALAGVRLPGRRAACVRGARRRAKRGGGGGGGGLQRRAGARAATAGRRGERRVVLPARGAAAARAQRGAAALRRQRQRRRRRRWRGQATRGGVLQRVADPPLLGGRDVTPVRGVERASELAEVTKGSTWHVDAVNGCAPEHCGVASCQLPTTCMCVACCVRVRLNRCMFTLVHSTYIATETHTCSMRAC